MTRTNDELIALVAEQTRKNVDRRFKFSSDAGHRIQASQEMTEQVAFEIEGIAQLFHAYRENDMVDPSKLSYLGMLFEQMAARLHDANEITRRACQEDYGKRLLDPGEPVQE